MKQSNSFDLFYSTIVQPLEQWIQEKQENQVMTAQQRLTELGNLLAQTQTAYDALCEELRATNSVAHSDRVATQNTFNPQSIEAGTIFFLLNEVPQSNGKQMLKGIAYIGDGSPEPIECPCVMWQSASDKKSAFHGKIESGDTQVGSAWVYLNENNTVISVNIDIGSPEFDGNYKGELGEGLADFDFACTVTKEEPKIQPKLAQLGQKQKMFTSTATQVASKKTLLGSTAPAEDEEFYTSDDDEEAMEVAAKPKAALSPLLRRR